MDLVLFIIAGVGLTNLCVNGSIFDTPREYLQESRLGKLLHFPILLSCMMCFGFWSGLMLSFLSPCLGLVSLNPLVSGFVISLASHLYSSVLYALDYLSGE